MLRGQYIDTSYTASFGNDLLGEFPAAATDVKDRIRPGYGRLCHIVAGVCALFDRVVDEVLAILGIFGDRALRAMISIDGPAYIERIPHSVYITNLVAIICGDRHLADMMALMVQFDNDFRVEVKIIRHVREVDVF